MNTFTHVIPDSYKLNQITNIYLEFLSFFYPLDLGKKSSLVLESFCIPFIKKYLCLRMNRAQSNYLSM